MSKVGTVRRQTDRQRPSLSSVSRRRLFAGIATGAVLVTTGAAVALPALLAEPAQGSSVLGSRVPGDVRGLSALPALPLLGTEPPASPVLGLPDPGAAIPAQTLAEQDAGKTASLRAATGQVAAQKAAAEKAAAAQAAAAQAAAEQALADKAAAERTSTDRAARSIDRGTDGWVRPSSSGITSRYGQRWGRLHAGLDFGAPYGSPIYAAADGVVSFAGAANGFGKLVTIRHADGSTTAYGHMSAILVSTGDRVGAGQTIAQVGNEGHSTGPHLHFEVRIGDGTVDPAPWLRKHGVNV